MAPTCTVFQRSGSNLRSHTSIFYRLFFVISNFNSIIFFSNKKKFPRSARCLWKILRDFLGGQAPSKTPRDEGSRRHAPAPPSTPADGRTHAAAAHPHTPHPHAAATCAEERSRLPPPPPISQRERIGDTVCRSIYTLML
nr:hypothetical protein [uncultured bacterium]